MSIIIFNLFSFSQDYRGLKSKVCSTNSLSSSTCSSNFSKALAEARGSFSTSNPLLNLADSSNNTETQLIDIPRNNIIPPAAAQVAANTPAAVATAGNQINDSNMNLLEEFLSPSVSISSTPVPLPIQTNNNTNNVATDTLIDVALSTSAPASGTGSPVNTAAVRTTRPTVYKHRKSSSASSGGSFSMIFGKSLHLTLRPRSYRGSHILWKTIEISRSHFYCTISYVRSSKFLRMMTLFRPNLNIIIMKSLLKQMYLSIFKH